MQKFLMTPENITVTNITVTDASAIIITVIIFKKNVTHRRYNRMSSSHEQEHRDKKRPVMNTGLLDLQTADNQRAIVLTFLLVRLRCNSQIG